jgi:hypothetical protein
MARCPNDPEQPAAARARSALRRPPLDDCLRKCIALGLALRSDDLRNWATQELEGYSGIEDLPAYRRVPVSIIGDVYRPSLHNLPVPTSQLPEAFQAMIRDGGYPMPDGIAAVSSHVEQAKRDGFLKVSIPDSDRLAAHLSPSVLRLGAIHSHLAPDRTIRREWPSRPRADAGNLHPGRDPPPHL